jgi:hypothetical protein
MKQSLTVLLMVVAVASVALFWLGQGRGVRKLASASIGTRSVSEGSSATSIETRSVSEGASSLDASILLAQSVAEIRRLPSVDAKLRMQSHLLDQELAGTGTYYQLVRSPGETLFKLELKLQVANQVSSLLQVNDGRFLWTRRDLPNQKSLSRIDQRRIQQALADAGRGPPLAMGASLLQVGGLGDLLEALQRSFDYEAPRETTHGGAAVYQLRGVWKPEALAELWPAKAESLRAGRSFDVKDLPAQLPAEVIILLSRDPSLSGFPYRIEYLRQGRAGERQSLVALDFYDIRRNVSLDPRLFAYKPGDQEVVDMTEAHLNGLGLK